MRGAREHSGALHRPMTSAQTRNGLILISSFLSNIWYTKSCCNSVLYFVHIWLVCRVLVHLYYHTAEFEKVLIFDFEPMQAHREAVSAISSCVESFHREKTPFRIYHGSTNSTQHRKVDRKRMVDTSGLNHVLSVDRDKQTCLVEPNVAMDELVDAVSIFGLLPPVVMEFPGITVGGGFAGTAGESSGFKYGFFDRTVNWIEMVLPTGEIVVASPEERSDLFYGAAGTLGTLGVTTLLEIQLVQWKSYVELTYRPVTSITDALSTMNAATKIESNDFVDGVLFASDRGVIVSGRLTNELPSGSKMQRFSRAHDPWFYIHADRLASRQLAPIKQYTPTRDYMFRYDRGAVSTHTNVSIPSTAH